MMRVTPLTGDLPGLPAPCGSCVFWQEPRRTVDAERKRRWSERASELSGSWGLVLWAEDRFQGLIQYGPVQLFARSRFLPAGPPSADAALITCMWVDEDDPVGIAERLVLEALADLKSRGATAVETFAVILEEEDRQPQHAGHRTLQDADLLERLGFVVVRGDGAVALMRLELGGLQPAPSPGARVVERLRNLTTARRPAPEASR